MTAHTAGKLIKPSASATANAKARQTKLKAAKKTNVLYVNLKNRAKLTVDRADVDELVVYFGVDSTSVVHLALARLRDEVRTGRVSSAADLMLPLAAAWPTPQQVAEAQRASDPRLDSTAQWQEPTAEFAAALALM